MENYGREFDELIGQAKGELKDYLSDYEGYLCDLHNEVFNTSDYSYITSKAEQELEGLGVFQCVRLVKEYELDNFGELYTKLEEPCKLLNMVYYIIGEELINELFDDYINGDAWDSLVDDELRKELLELIN